MNLSRDEAKDLIDGLTSICELTGLMRIGLINNGFIREEAVHIISRYFSDVFNSTGKVDSDE